MAVTVAAVRQAASTAVDAVPGTSVSRYAADLFGRDVRTLVHKSFSVDTPGTRVLAEAGPERQMRTEGALVETDVRIQVAHRCQVEAMVSNYDDALGFESDVIKAVKAASASGGIRWIYSSSTREVTAAGEFYFITINFRAVHQLALA